ncbi:MAG: HD domain-containing protein [Planktothrix sp.]
MKAHGLTRETLPKKGDKVLWKGNTYTLRHIEGFQTLMYHPELKDNICFCVFQSSKDKQMNHYTTTSLYSDTFLLALTKASEWHQHQSRFNGFPYLYHLLRVAGYVGEMTKDEDVVIAALLHDCVEDVSITFTELEDTFGPNVANIIAFITEDKSLPKAERKKEYIQGLRYPGCPVGSLIISIYDKYDSLMYYQSERYLVTPDVIEFMSELLNVYREKVEKGVLVSESSKSYKDLLDEMDILLSRLKDD